MPSTATITAFYNFVADTRAASAEVNYNFSNFRGHTVPVDPTTSAAVGDYYSLGAPDNRWRTANIQNLDISITTTVSNIVEAMTSGGIDFKRAGSSLFKLGALGFIGSPANLTGPTTTAAAGYYAVSAELNGTITASGYVAGSTCTIVSSGRPIWIGLMNNSGGSGYIESYITNKLNRKKISVSFGYDGLLSAPHVAALQNPGLIDAPGNTNGSIWLNFRIPQQYFSTLLFLSAGSHTLALYLNNLSTTGYNILSNVKLMAYELP